MKINGLDFVRLRNDTHFQFHTELRDLVEAENPETLGIKALFDTYKALYAREDEALKKIIKSSLTEDIAAADAARDKIYGNIVKLISVMSEHFNPNIAAAGKRIKVVLDTYGNVSRKTLVDQTSAIYNLLQELNLPRFSEDRINVSINPWLNELKNCNEDFEALMKKRVKEEAFRTDINMKDARRELDAAYYAIKERINAAIIMEGPEKYESFVKQLNVVISKHAAKKQHHHHKHPADSVAGETDAAGVDSGADGDGEENG